MAKNKPPYSHREMAKILFTPSRFEKQISIIPTWLKVEAYTLIFEALPHVIAVAIWAAVITAIYWGLKLI